MTFDKAIVVTGTPQLTIKVGAADRTATCALKGSTGDDAKKLVCSYTVAEGDADIDGVSVEANKLSLPSGASIKDVSDVAATLTHEALGAQSGHKVGAPTVPSSWGVGLSVSPTTLTDTDFTGSPRTKEVTLTLSGQNNAEDSLVWAGADPNGGLNARGVFQRRWDDRRLFCHDQGSRVLHAERRAQRAHHHQSSNDNHLRFATGVRNAVAERNAFPVQLYRHPYGQPQRPVMGGQWCHVFGHRGLRLPPRSQAPIRPDPLPRHR